MRKTLRKDLQLEYNYEELDGLSSNDYLNAKEEFELLIKLVEEKE